MVNPQFTLGFIGFGKIASAIWEGLSKHPQVSPSQVYFCSRNPEKEKQVAIKYGLIPVSLDTLIKKAQLIVLAIKPQDLEEAARLFPEEGLDVSQVLISVLAGTPLSKLEKAFGPIALARAMPNTPSYLGEGATGLTFNQRVSPPYRKAIHDLFSKVGLVMEVEEKQLDTITGLSGSGPAFCYQWMHAAALEAERLGLPYKTALKCIAQTLIGAGKMVLETDDSPESLIQAVASSKGTTAAGLSEWNHRNLDTHIQAVIAATVARAQSLSKE